MCGISGVLSVKPVNPATIEKMVTRLHHRGPDGSGLFTALNGRLALGHNRLSIIDLSKANAQPFRAHSADVAFVFNGEIYNFKALRAELEKLGHTFHTTGDTEVVLDGYLEWGEGIFSRLAGMFALAIWDGRNRTLLLSRDTFGIKPLYYYADGVRFLFGSEVKAIFADSSVRREFHLPTVIDLASFGFHLSHETVYEGVSQLPPGYLIVACLDAERVTYTLKPFLTLGDVITAASNSKNITSDFVRERLAESVAAHLVSDAPLAMSLSGGLDSSTVCALASCINPDILCYTVGYGEESDETPFGRQVSAHLGIRQIVAQAQILDFGSLFRRIVWHFEEPVPHIQALTPFFLGQTLNRSRVKVVLLGEGSDEIFGGYPWQALARLPVGPAGIFAAYARWRRAANYYLEVLFSKDIFASRVKERLTYHFDEFMRLWKSSTGTPLQRFLYFDCTYQLVYSQLLRVDKMLMAHSVEGRVPFLYGPLVSSIWDISDSQRIRGPVSRFPFVQGKIIVRQAMRDLLPAPVVGRIKFGRTGTQNLYQVGIQPLLRKTIARVQHAPTFSTARDVLSFINWGEANMSKQLSPKLQLFLLMILNLSDLAIERGFERPSDFDQPVVEISV